MKLVSRTFCFQKAHLDFTCCKVLSPYTREIRGDFLQLVCNGVRAQMLQENFELEEKLELGHLECTHYFMKKLFYEKVVWK
jgi:hypothetical protein